LGNAFDFRQVSHCSLIPLLQVSQASLEFYATGIFVGQSVRLKEVQKLLLLEIGLMITVLSSGDDGSCGLLFFVDDLSDDSRKGLNLLNTMIYGLLFIRKIHTGQSFFEYIFLPNFSILIRPGDSSRLFT